MSKRLLSIGLLIGFSVGFLGGCPSNVETLLEEARFALDNCNPTTYNSTSTTTSAGCDDAVTKANLVLADDAGNVDAAVIAASGHIGKAGVDFLQFVSKLTEVEANTSGSTTQFTQFQSLISTVETENTAKGGSAISLDELKAAIDVLSTALTGKTASDALNKRALFQLGTIQGLDTFIRPIKRTTTIAATGNLDPSGITADDADLVKKNATSSDDNLASGGVTDANTLKATREGFCRCNNLTGIAYSAACLRDLIRCELSTTNAEDTEQDYVNATTTAPAAGSRTANCAALSAVKNTTGYTTCKANGV